jgi:uncharacterized protein
MLDWLRRAPPVSAAPAPVPAQPSSRAPRTFPLKPRAADAFARQELKLPELAAGVRPDNAPALAMDNAAWASQVTWGNGVGVSGVGCGLYFPGYQYLAELSQRSEYRAPVETLADEMTRRWIKLASNAKGDMADKIAQIKDRMEELEVQSLFRTMEVYDGFFGRGQLYIDIQGQDGERDKPLTYEPAKIGKGALLGFKAIEPMWTTPVTWNASDPFKADFYKPTMWYVLGVPTHSTRLLTFISRPLPDLLKPSYNFGGISLTQLMEPYVNQWLRTRDAVSDIVYQYSILILATDMTQLLSADGQDDSSLDARLQYFNQLRNNRGVFAIDKDSEAMQQIAVPLSSLDQLMAQMQEHQCAPSHMPMVKLTGVTPSGLNASSDGEIQVWYDYIKARQVAAYGSRLKIVMDLVQLDIFGSVDPAITYQFESLTEPDGEAEARIRKADAERAQVYIDGGVISREEERERIANDPNSGYDNLSLQDLPPDPLEAQQQAMMGQPDENQAGGDV